MARSRSFYTDYLGLRLAQASPPGAVLFDTQPIPFAATEPRVDPGASPKLGWGVWLWLAADDAQALHDRLANARVSITALLTRGPFGLSSASSTPMATR